MQQLTSRPPQAPYPRPAVPPRHTGTADRSFVVLITALVLFALAGVLSGFAVGTINRPNHTQTLVTTHSSPGDTTKIPAKTGDATKTPTTVSVVPLGCPIPDVYTPAEVPDGKTAYTASAYATDHSANCGKPLTASGITFKLWLTKRISHFINFPQGAQSVLQNINAPIEGKAINKSNQTDGDVEDVQGLQFVTAQVQQSNAQGRVTWQYIIPTSVNPGEYDLIFLVDWKGQQYNWSWRDITIKKAS